MTFNEIDIEIEGRKQAWREQRAQSANEILILAMQNGMKEREAQRVFKALVDDPGEKTKDYSAIADLIEISHERARKARAIAKAS